MATTAEVLIDALGRVRESVDSVLDGLTEEQLSYRIDGRANSIAWLVWHLTRIQDDHIAEVADIEQVYTAQGFNERFGLPFDDADTGYGHSDADVAAVKVGSPDLLRDYHRAVYEQSERYLSTQTDEDMDRVVDERWDPPVTLAVRLVSVLDDDMQHAGQAGFVRGLLPR